MIIEKFVKLKDGMYKLELDNKLDLKIHEDLILKYNLLVSKELDENNLYKIVEENKIYEIYNIALKYLSRRVRSVKEVNDYLLEKEYEIDVINEVIKKLKEQGYLDDKIYVKSLVNDRIRLNNYGPFKIKRELLDNGIEEDLIDEVLLIYSEDLEREKITKIINKHQKSNTKSNMALKIKLKNNLINLGFNIDLINEELNQINGDEEELLKKEYEKLRIKLSKKYSGKELELKIRQKLYQKGFIIK